MNYFVSFIAALLSHTVSLSERTDHKTVNRVVKVKLFERKSRKAAASPTGGMLGLCLLRSALKSTKQNGKTYHYKLLFYRSLEERR